MKKVSLTLVLVLSFLRLLAQADERIITAGSALTETVCALGKCEKIIASDRTSLYPSEIQKLPSIGYRSSISSEGIISLKPTLVIVEKDYVADAVIAQIRSAGIKIVVIERTYSLEGTKKMILEIAGHLNKKLEASALLKSIEGQVSEASAIVKKAKNVPRVLCIYNRGTDSFDVAGTRTFSEILPYVGAENGVQGVNGYKPLNTEAMIAANPDFFLFLESGLKSLGGIEGVLKVPGVGQTKAGQSRQILAMDGIKLTNFGPRFGEAVKELALLIHPGLTP